MRLALVVLTASLLGAAAPAIADSAGGAPSPASHVEKHRYVVERTFPPGALAGLNAETKAAVNATNAKYGVRWVMSYANADKTKTYCIYEGPNEVAIRSAATANKLPVDTVTEVPVTLLPK